MKPDPMSGAVKRMARRARRDPAKVYEEIEDDINRGRITVEELADPRRGATVAGVSEHLPPELMARIRRRG